MSVVSCTVNELANLPKVKGYSNCMHLLGAAGGRICIIEVVLGTYLTGNPALPAGGVLPLLRQKFAQPQVCGVCGGGGRVTRGGALLICQGMGGLGIRVARGSPSCWDLGGGCSCWSGVGA
jgi:hypothetical protein